MKYEWVCVRNCRRTHCTDEIKAEAVDVYDRSMDIPKGISKCVGYVYN